MNKTKLSLIDAPIWNIEQPINYAKAFVHIFESPDWLDFLKGNENLDYLKLNQN